jgi:hypothetical protein
MIDPATPADVITGSDIIGALLLAHEPLTSVVPVERIKAARLGEVPLPALVVTEISSVDRQTLTIGRFVRTTDRVSVTVRTASHRDRKRAIRLVRQACAGRTGTIAGAHRVSVLTAGRGPEMDGPGDSFEQAQDFKVSFDQPAF